MIPLFNTVDGNDGITINESTVIWVLVVILLVLAILFVANRIR